MSHALEGPPRPVVTLTEQANGQRLCRSMFIGHSVGYLLIITIMAVVLGSLGFARPVAYDAVFGVTDPATVLHYPYMGLHPYATLGLALLSAVFWTDLTVRRRHDRGRSGVDAVIWQILLLASVILHTFADAADIVGYLDAVLVLGALYLFVVLVLLPGDTAANRYGPKPRPD